MQVEGIRVHSASVQYTFKDTLSADTRLKKTKEKHSEFHAFDLKELGLSKDYCNSYVLDI